MENNISRRGFVVKSAVGIGGLAISRYTEKAAYLKNKSDKLLSKGKTKEVKSQSNFVADKNDIIIENDGLRLVIGSNAIAKSLICKSTGEECLIKNNSIPISTITQERPYQNEVKLAYPNEEITFKANSIQQEGDKLILGYQLIPYKAVIKLKINAQYLEFSLEDFIMEGYGIDIKEPPVWHMWFVQLPVRKRTYYGDWLKVVWDDQNATNILAIDPHARIEAEEGEDFYILKAGAERDVKLKGANAALIACPTNKLLDNIDQIEKDHNLAHGVESRRSKEYKFSYYWTTDINPNNLNSHLKYAKMGGFRAMLIYYPAFLNSNGYRNLGNYEWKRSLYPNGKEDLRKLLIKVQNEGIVPGIHTLHSHIGLNSKYVTPNCDHRLNVTKIFSLAAPLGKDDTTIHIDQNPNSIEMAEGRRILRVGSELISYTGYTSERPYQIKGCKRGALGTSAGSYPVGYMFGVLDVSEFGAQSVYINQDNDLQDEIAEKLQDIYNAGFRFWYADGSEGVNPPFWDNVSWSQWRVYRKFQPEPLFAEGAAKTHFSWHMLSRGNAFDIFKPEVLKESIKKHPAAEAPRMKQNFSHLNFGWLGYWVPDQNTIGTQPDMLEYATSRAAAWDCPIGIQTNLKKFDDHARTADNLEVLRRWEDVRVNNWLTDDQKLMLQKLDQEHILLLNEKNEPELQPYDQITNVANNSNKVRAFIFQRNNNLYVVYWHISGAQKLELQLNHKNVTLKENLKDKSSVPFSKRDENITIPVSDRRYLITHNISKEELINAFANAKLL